MKPNPKEQVCLLCSLHSFAMRRVLLEPPTSNLTQSFHHCERRNCSPIFRDGYDDSDLADGQSMHRAFLPGSFPRVERPSASAEADRVGKVEMWKWAEVECGYSEDLFSPDRRAKSAMPALRPQRGEGMRYR